MEYLIIVLETIGAICDYGNMEYFTAIVNKEVHTGDVNMERLMMEINDVVSRASVDYEISDYPQYKKIKMQLRFLLKL